MEEIGEKVNKAKVAILSREVTASSATQAHLYNEAKQFAAANRTTATIEAASREQGLPFYQATGLDKKSQRVNNMSQTRQIVRWAYENNTNNAPHVFVCYNQYIVSTSTKVKK